MRQAVSALALSVLLASCSPGGEYEKTFMLMGTVVRVEARATGDPESAVDAAAAAMEKTAAAFNIFEKGSEISRLNSEPGKERVRVSPKFFDLFMKAKSLYAVTGGALDVTAEPLLEAWGIYGKETALAPDDAEIKSAMECVGMNLVSCDAYTGELVFAKPCVKFDMNAIVPGYAVDAAADVLKQSGITSAIIDGGGEIRCIGKKGRAPWRVGIRDPERKNSLFAVMNLEDSSVSTSGAYENFVVIDGRHYGHVIDPRAGAPAQNDILSATAMAPSCAAADGLSTAFLLLSPEESLKIADSFPGIECVIIEKGGQIPNVYLSSGVRGLKLMRGANVIKRSGDER